MGCGASILETLRLRRSSWSSLNDIAFLPGLRSKTDEQLEGDYESSSFVQSGIVAQSSSMCRRFGGKDKKDGWAQGGNNHVSKGNLLCTSHRVQQLQHPQTCDYAASYDRLPVTLALSLPCLP
jgi:hypothetical protein